ncbi:MAG: hypothetical protein LAT82_03365 [Nanoarchaeota archaeon]|nr:hypothetical protein [Nanoarchaeota archaeon]
MDFNSYFNYAYRLWTFDENVHGELRESQAPSIGTNYLFFSVIGFVMGIIFILSELVGTSVFSGSELVFYLIGALFGAIILIPLSYLIFSLWSQLWINIFGGDQPLSKTFELFTYIYIPSFIVGATILVIQTILGLFIRNETALILASLPLNLISFGVGVYAIAVIIKTFSITHNMQALNVVLAGAISFVTLFLMLLITGLIIGFVIGFLVGFNNLLV